MIMLPLRAKVWSLVVVLTAALVPEGAFAQISNVTCLSSFGWMNNSIEQNPCLVTVYLQNPCGNGSIYVIDPLPPGSFYYAPPSVVGANLCECNTVTYSMISACSVCQNGSYMSWSSWSSGCNNQMSIGESVRKVVDILQAFLIHLINRYPLDIPAGTKVPNWAYLSVTGGGFNSTVAQSDGDLPESTATGVPSTTTVIYSTTLPASLTTVYSSYSSSSFTTTGPSTTSSSTSSHVGAIAGGVVGGIAGAAVIIGLATWFFVKRYRASTTLSAGISNVDGHPGHTQSVYSTNVVMFPMVQQPRLYDPSDPTTFPVHPHPTDLVTSSNNMVLNTSSPPRAYIQQSHLGKYTGVPQV
ncbi:hypothetical protein BDR07DRAFT_686701 [Suillus spraguei]|nr:hypothetical protein BDR07DRAFT_686701 [Suillus spraguei]